MLQAPAADQFPRFPVSWYLFGASRELRRPVSRDLLGRRLVAFRTSEGKPVVLDARCSHLGCDLGKGQVRGERIQCPFHQWEYGADGRCEHIPAASSPPAWARQTAYACVERHGYLFFFNGSEPLFPLPFFDGESPEDFVAAQPFGTTLACPWYMIGSNAFDLQHFKAAHERRLVGEPRVDCPHPFARRASASFSVSGDSLQDRLTRWFAGDEVEMAITDWCGTIMCATATFRRTRSYGFVVTEPRADGRVTVRVIVFVRRSAGAAGRLLRDPIQLWIRRTFIRRFLSSDAARLDGAAYNPRSLIDADRDLAEYFDWLAHVSRGAPKAQHMASANSNARVPSPQEDQHEPQVTAGTGSVAVDGGSAPGRG
jgi:nitrite reductase/ring-hydroxylating ferredoxin subunit